MSKYYVILYIYDLLLSKTRFNTKDIETKFNISYRTVKRYISNIKDYILATSEHRELIYSSAGKTYKIVEF